MEQTNFDLYLNKNLKNTTNILSSI